MAGPDAQARLDEALELHKSKRLDEAEAIYRELLETLPQSALVHNMLGVLEGQRQNHKEAIRWLESAIGINERIADFHDNLGAALLATGRVEDAQRRFRKALDLQPERDSARAQLARTLLPGEAYPALIERVLRWREPKVYIEFGIRDGRTLALARKPTFAIGVQRNPSVSERFEAETRVYDMLPQEFLESGRMEAFTGRKSFDVALLRAPRNLEAAYDLFAAVEGFAAKDAIVILHGTLPPDPVAGGPDRQSKFWVGDQWKLVPCLMAVRPELTLFSVPAYPVGLTFVTGLRRRSKQLEKNRDENIAAFAATPFPPPEDWKKAFNLGSENWSAIRRRLGKAAG